jgi:hypothetical protein
MSQEVSSEVAKLPSFTRQQLLDLWLKLYGRAAPPGIRRELMVPFLGYRIQERAYGGLKAATRAQLLRIARALENPTSTTEWLSKPKIKAGTRILRQWRGEIHEIMVTESGYEYRAASYRSLSEIARKITGTRWSGPAFFGLKDKSSVRGRSDA